MNLKRAKPDRLPKMQEAQIDMKGTHLHSFHIFSGELTANWKTYQICTALRETKGNYGYIVSGGMPPGYARKPHANLVGAMVNKLY